VRRKFDELYDVDARRDPLIEEYVQARDLVHRDWRKALQDLEALSHRGSIMSILYVSDCMQRGQGYETDLPGAERWYRVAVASGSARGVWGLAMTHLLMRKYDLAIEGLELAISQSYPPAINSLAGIYFRGDGVPVDKSKSLKLYLRGTSLGHFYSKRNLVALSMRGSFGFWRALVSPWVFITLVVDVICIFSTNRYTDRLR
jgi:TPR repeat protein